ncbi:hypothetical protein [Saccharibacillus qingshengii]|uniref:hypothetical protein n=1 Tax=Saccharibacillus qingshengii TaxID=1763540 RepID=UPI00155789F3|nr:hypothetical protein [Saccharibacillus qingshengii]
MYGHTFAQALCKLGGDELRLVYVLCCDTAVQELLVSKIRGWIKREPQRFAAQLQEKALAYREWNDDELRLAILLELAKRSRLHGAPLTTAAELEEFAGGIVEHIELGAAEEDRAYFVYREEHPEASALEALIDYQNEQLIQGLGRLLDAAPQSEWEAYIRRIEPFLPEDLTDLPEASYVSDTAGSDFDYSRSDTGSAEEYGGSEQTDPILDLPGIAESPAAAAAQNEAVEEEHVIREDSQIAGSEPAAAPVRLNKTEEAAEEPFGSAGLTDAEYESLLGSEQDFEEPEAASEPAAPLRPSGVKLLLAALEHQRGCAHYEAVMSLLASAEGLFGIGEMPELYGRRLSFRVVSASPAFLNVLPGGGAKNAPKAIYRSLNPQRRRLPLLLVQLFLPELVSEDETEADYGSLLALWRSRAEQHGAFKSELAEEDSRIEYYKRESASCAEQLEAARTERAASKKRITDIRESLVSKLRVSSMQLPPISESFDHLLKEYADNRHRIEEAESSRRERGQGFSALIKYTLNYAASSVSLIDLKRKQDRLLGQMAEEALRTDGEWGQGERYVVAAEQERIGFLEAEIDRLEKLQTEYREELRRSEQARKALEQSKKKLEKQVYGLMDL